MKTLLQLCVIALVTGALAFGVLRYLRSGGEAPSPAEQESAATALPPLSPAAERGRQAAATLGCNACHSLDGSPGIGPSWYGAHGSMRLFTDGSSLLADDAYLHSSIVDPSARVVQGFENVMLPADASDAQIADILALIRELSPTQFQ